MLTKIKKLLLIARPISWPNTAFPFAATYLVTGGGFDATFIIGTLYFLIPYNLMMYGVNDVFDYESDIRNPRKGGVEGMREQRAFHPTIIRWTLYANIPPAVYLLATSGVTAAMLLAVTVFLAVAYSAPPFRLKERPLLDSLTSSLHFVGPMLYALSLTESLASTLAYSGAFFAWGIASHAFGAVQDINPDRKAGIHSIATQFGARKTVWLAGVLYLIALCILFADNTLGATIIGVMGLAYVANIAPYVRVSDKKSEQTNAGWRRFLWLNYVTGFIVTMVLLIESL